MDGSMQDLRPQDRPSESDESRAQTGADAPTPREALRIFTAGWLGGAGLLTAVSGMASPAMRWLAVAQAVAAVVWFFPKLRMAGFGAMLAVLAITAVLDLAIGRQPGAIIFYAAIVGYLVWTERRRAEG
jgi:hypothetical protein